MITLARRVAVLPTWALGGPPLFLSVALGLAVRHHRPRRPHR